MSHSFLIFFVFFSKISAIFMTVMDSKRLSLQPIIASIH